MSEAAARQNRAASPERSSWVAANAGSGKTTVLTNRVARLLLAGTDPARVLCLTYTKAAASEMQSRLFRTLGAWAMLDDAPLAALAVGDPDFLAALGLVLRREDRGHEAREEVRGPRDADAVVGILGEFAGDLDLEARARVARCVLVGHGSMVLGAPGARNGGGGRRRRLSAHATDTTGRTRPDGRREARHTPGLSTSADPG